MIRDNEREEIRRLIYMIATGLFIFFLGKAFQSEVNINKHDKVPKLKAENLICDFKNDSLFLTYIITNEFNTPVRNIRQISLYEDNIFTDMLDSKNEVVFGSKMTLYSVARKNFDSVNMDFSSTLYLFYDVTINEKEETYYMKYTFYSPSLNTKSQTLFPVSTSEAEKVSNIDSLLNKLCNFSDKLSREEGSLLIFFNPDFYSNGLSIIITGGQKQVLFSKKENKIYFNRLYKDSIGVIISQPLLFNSSISHNFAISWGSEYSLLMVDGSGYTSDSSFRQELKLYPEKIYRNMGLIFFKNEAFKEAITYLEKSLKIDPKSDFITYEKIFLSYVNVGNTNSAINSLEKAIENGHRDSSILVNLARAYEESKNYTKAIEYYKLDNRLNKSHSGFIFYSSLLIYLNQIEEAENLLKFAIKLFPNSVGLNCNYGIVMSIKNDFIPAGKYFEKAYNLDSTDIEVKKNIVKYFNKIYSYYSAIYKK
ncbi:MAG: tetratricopeptide repeat protein [Ignavibacteriae bacterium]|nr:tetratricopeptide repeat protein [Ignavibacteriota bacterium]